MSPYLAWIDDYLATHTETNVLQMVIYLAFVNNVQCNISSSHFASTTKYCLHIFFRFFHMYAIINSQI